LILLEFAIVGFFTPREVFVWRSFLQTVNFLKKAGV